MEPKLAKNDSEFAAWLAANPAGFVGNMRASKSPSSLVAHTARCPLIQPGRQRVNEPGSATENSVRKAVATTLPELIEWGQRNGFDPAAMEPCPRCEPGDLRPLLRPPVAVTNPSYWWVNQNQTYVHEIEGGYMWSPKTKANGHRNRFYENMKEVRPGDIVFSFRNATIAAAGRITSTAYECPKPLEFEEAGKNWSDVGWKVDVRYREVPEPQRPKDYIGDLRPHLPQKYSPLQPETGDGLQSVYLAAVPPAMAEVVLTLVELGGGSVPPALDGDGADDDEARWADAIANREQARIDSDAELDETEKEALVRARRGQGKFRTDVLKIEPQCRVTRVENPDYLRASHIWPWRHCTNRERLDPNNGLMLTPSVDHLFDKGHISFSDAGQVLVSPVADEEALARLGVRAGQSVGPFSSEQRRYLRRHREGADGKGSIFKRISG